MVGITRTKDIVMRSRRISGQQAYDWGIATEVHPDDQLEAATDALVAELVTFAPLAQRTAKKLLNETEECDLQTAIDLEGHCYSRLRQSDDFREGVEAFHEKRKPAFAALDGPHRMTLAAAAGRQRTQGGFDQRSNKVDVTSFG